MRFFNVVIVSCFCCLSFSQQSELSFLIKNFGINVDGQFNRYKIEIIQDDDGSLVSISGVVYVKTVETGIDARDEHLQTEAYFDALKYPEIVLESTSVLPLDNTRYRVEARLSIKGVTKTINFRGTLLENNWGPRFETEFEINRQDFSVGGGGVLGKVVKVRVIYYLRS